MKQEILEYNKRCAEFLGLKKGWWIHQEKPLTDDKKQWWDIDGKTFLGTRVYYDKDLQFHSDWNWIMEVVEAIERLNYTFIIDNQHCYWYKEYIKEAKSGLGASKKEAVVQAINQFLIWYNEQAR